MISNSQFQRVGIIARYKQKQWVDTLVLLLACLNKLNVKIILEKETAEYGGITHPNLCDKDQLGKNCDLLIVIGGDGSFLQAVHAVIEHEIPIVGINRGRLGFLTDIAPQEIENKIPAIIRGEYREEKRFLLNAEIHREGKVTFQECALNEVVLLPGSIAHMIEFEIFINDHFVVRQRADGLIAATPTGSTAYALSGGGPILHPALAAIALVPMFPHTLSSRPLVVSKDSVIRIQLPSQLDSIPSFSCDGFERHALHSHDKLLIRAKEKHLRLIHPLDYDYFHTLRSKLNWEQSAIKEIS